jgi:hypothetical protein
MVKKLTNEIIEIKGNFGEDTLAQRPFRPFFRKSIMPPKPQEHVTSNLDFEGKSMGHIYNYH